MKIKKTIKTDYSIYNPFRFNNCKNEQENLLNELSSTNLFGGIELNRNLFKPIVAFELLIKQEDIIKKLKIRNTENSKDIFECLSLFYHDLATENETVKQILKISEYSSIKDLIDSLHCYAEVQHAEIHPTDNCNLNCLGCTYQNQHSISSIKEQFPLSSMDSLKKINPKTIVIVGGGEPTLYKNLNFTIDDFILHLKKALPNSHFGMITNGTFLAPGDWLKHLEWIRISIDSASTNRYAQMRGKNLFDKVIINLHRYLKSDVPKVGVSFLYSKFNYDEYFDFFLSIFNRVSLKEPDLLHKLQFHFRPLRHKDNKIDIDHKDYISNVEIDKISRQIQLYLKKNREIINFLQNNTNIYAYLGGNVQPVYSFERCFYSRVFHIIRPNGDLLPCSWVCDKKEHIIGNILQDSAISIALKKIFVTEFINDKCKKELCLQNHVNYILDLALNEKIVLEDYQINELKKDGMF